jgi:hypothetical protein
MTNETSSQNSTLITPMLAAKTERASELRQIVLNEIGAKWGKFSEQELSALKSKDDLITQLVAKYSLEKANAQPDALLKGCYLS